jgi:hypothetical protein
MMFYFIDGITDIFLYFLIIFILMEIPSLITDIKLSVSNFVRIYQWIFFITI